MTEPTRFEDKAAAIGLTFFGSDCRACEGNTTYMSMSCDSCGSSLHTVALWSGPVENARPL